MEEEIEAALMLEKGLIEDPSLPISGYNYSAIRDRLAKHDIKVALSTIISRARSLGCYQPHPKKKAHDREVVTTAIGALIQHDASHHKWSPYAGEHGRQGKVTVHKCKNCGRTFNSGWALKAHLGHCKKPNHEPKLLVRRFLLMQG